MIAGKRFILAAATAGIFGIATLFGEEVAGYRPDYARISSASRIQDRDFYLLTLFARIAEVRTQLLSGPAAKYQKNIWGAGLGGLDYPSSVREFILSPREIASFRAELVGRVPLSRPLQKLVEAHLRPSGDCILSAGEPDPQLLGDAWTETADGINHIITQFVFGEGMRYPEIDGPSYNPADPGYRQMVLQAAQESQKPSGLFFEPSLRFAMRLMALNRRDEPARFAPLPEGENRAACRALRHVDWSKYRYASIIIHGIGPDNPGQAIPEEGRANCAAAARLYRAGLAPVIIPSGGFVHPKQTIFCEAYEMKKELMLVYSIPESAILIEPYARHTTTNVRNAVRLLFSISAPSDKPSLSVSLPGHIDSIASPNFTRRCETELGYLPARYGRRISATAIEFLPHIQSLQIDPTDPLDP